MGASVVGRAGGLRPSGDAVRLLCTVSADPTSGGATPDEPKGLSSSLDSSKQLDGSTEAEILSPPQTLRDDFRVTPIDHEENVFRHSGWAVRRRQTFHCLNRIGASPGRLDRFCNCGSGCCVEVNDATGEARLNANYCRDRLCLPCGRSRSARVTRALIAEAGKRTVRFATFTLRHTQTPLADQIDRLYRSFSALRRRAFFKSKCTGGAAVLEVKLGKEGLWHVHLHCLLLGSFIDQAELSREWYRTTGDSYVVDIRKVDSGHASIRYCAAYVGKPVDAGIYQSQDKLDEAARALHGRRVVNTWGEWAKLDLDADDDSGGNWVVVGRLSKLIRDAREGDRAAKALLTALSPFERSNAASSSTGESG